MASKSLQIALTILVIGTLSCAAQDFTFINIPSTSPSYLLSYTIQSDVVMFEVTAETKGYVGFGFTNVSGMIDSDIFIGGVNDDGSTYFGDFTSRAVGLPTRDAEQNWNVMEATENQTFTHIKFSRFLSTSDLQDIIIEDKPMNIIWSIGSTDSLEYHAQKSSLIFNLISEFTSETTTNPPTSEITTTGVTTTTASSTVTSTSNPTTGIPPTTPDLTDFIEIPVERSDYNISYKIDGDSITFHAVVQTKGFIGFGLTNSSGMTDSDIFVAGVDGNGGPYSGDYYSRSNGAPTLDEKQDWQLIRATEGTTETAVTFTRLMDTGDSLDVVIEDKIMKLIWAFSSADDLVSASSYHGTNRGQVSYNFFKGNGGTTDKPSDASALVFQPLLLIVMLSSVASVLIR